MHLCHTRKAKRVSWPFCLFCSEPTKKKNKKNKEDKKRASKVIR